MGVMAGVIHNFKTYKGALTPLTLRIDRASQWGNPFVIGIDGDRDAVCNLFEKYAVWRLKQQPDWLKPLEGRDVICWCAPLRCHGETLMKLLAKKKGTR